MMDAILFGLATASLVVLILGGLFYIVVTLSTTTEMISRTSNPYPLWLRRAPFVLVGLAVGLIIVALTFYGVQHVALPVLFGWYLVGVGVVCLGIGTIISIVRFIGAPAHPAARKKSRRIMDILFVNGALCVIAGWSLITAF